MQLNTTLKGNLTAATAATIALIFSNAMPSMAFSFMNPRSLNADELLADQSIFKLQTPWKLSGTLNGTVPFTTTFNFPFGITRNVTGSRNFISATTTSYSGIHLSEIQTKPCLAWFIARDSVPHATAHRYMNNNSLEATKMHHH